MAKWGEGDPRWIVEERPDAVNVNNWHWTEKNASHWSKEKLTSLLKDLVVEDENIGRAVLTQVTTIDGEAVANNRKAKLIFFYEWYLKGIWRGYPKDQIDVPEFEIEGEYEIPNLSEENNPEEVDVSFIICKGGNVSGSEEVKEMLRSKGTLAIQAKVAEYIRELKEEYAKDLILPTNVPSKTTTTKSAIRINNGLIDSSNSGDKLKAAAAKPTTVVTQTKSLRLEEVMKCRAKDFYRALVDPQMVSAFTQSAVVVDAKVGGEFMLLDGNVQGKFTELVEGKLIKQSWRFKSWPAEHYSQVQIQIEERSDDTLVTMEQTGIPTTDFERTENGWRRFYFDAMKRTFGFGSTLF